MSLATRRPLRIFIAHPSDLLTDHLPHGDGLVSFSFITRLAERGHELHIAAEQVDLRWAPPANVHIHRLSPRGRASAVNRLSFMLRMRALFERLRRQAPFDIIHQMNPVFTGLSLSLIGVRTPLVLGTFVPKWHDGVLNAAPRWAHGMRDRVRREVARLQQARAAGLLICSPEALSRIAQPAEHRDRIFEVPYGIDISEFAERTRVPPRPSVLFLASVLRRKGIFTLLEAFPQVAASVPDAELVIGGGSHDLPEVRRRIADMPGCAIRLLGPVPRADVQDVMREHSVYCLPSFGEPFGMTILEAMACGVPVVATRAGGIPDLVAEEGGRLVAPGDARALAAALIEILQSPDLQRAMGRYNRHRVEATYEAEKAVDRLEEAYAAILARRSSIAGNARGSGAGSPQRDLEPARHAPASVADTRPVP